MIEIPEGAIKAYLNNSKTINFINADDDYMNSATNGEWIDTHRGKHEACGHELIWQRPSHPEELPFIDDDFKLNIPEELKGRTDLLSGRIIIDDEPLKVIDSEYSKDGNSVTHTVSLNDQYAEIEKVRQSAWQKQEGGSHYKNLKIQPMQYALENKLDYAQANVVKYVTRHKEKNGKEDLLKAIHNLELMIEFYYGDEK